ncbi:MAG: hypothetical protein R6U27_11325 [Desulfobacterales bacterium]
MFIERLEYFREGLGKKGRTKSYPKIVEMIGRVREKYPGASKIYEVEVVVDDKSDKKSIVAKDIVWSKRPQYDTLAKFDDCYVLRTDRLNLSDKQIWETYVMLTRI